MATSQSAWVEQMLEAKRQGEPGSSDLFDELALEGKACCKGVDAEPQSEGAILHWLLKAAMPEWTLKELKSTKSKLMMVGVASCDDFEDALQEAGELNNRLRDRRLKAFAGPTLARFRSQIKAHRETQRMQSLLEERRRLDRERKVAGDLPPSSTGSTADAQEETDSITTEDVGTIASDVDQDQDRTGCMEEPPSSVVSIGAGFEGEEPVASENELCTSLNEELSQAPEREAGIEVNEVQDQDDVSPIAAVERTAVREDGGALESPEAIEEDEGSDRISESAAGAEILANEDEEEF